jgi:hypothetical protein
MSRPRKAAPPQRDAFPRLLAGWSALVGAALVPSLSVADVTPPKSGRNAAAPGTARIEPLPAPPKADKKTPCPLNADPAAKTNKAKAKPERAPRLVGEMGYHVLPARSPVFHAALHLHGPDEPCKKGTG